MEKSPFPFGGRYVYFEPWYKCMTPTLHDFLCSAKNNRVSPAKPVCSKVRLGIRKVCYNQSLNYLLMSSLTDMSCMYKGILLQFCSRVENEDATRSRCN